MDEEISFGDTTMSDVVEEKSQQDQLSPNNSDKENAVGTFADMMEQHDQAKPNRSPVPDMDKPLRLRSEITVPVSPIQVPFVFKQKDCSVPETDLFDLHHVRRINNTAKVNDDAYIEQWMIDSRQNNTLMIQSDSCVGLHEWVIYDYLSQEGISTNEISRCRDRNHLFAGPYMVIKFASKYEAIRGLQQIIKLALQATHHILVYVIDDIVNFPKEFNFRTIQYAFEGQCLHDEEIPGYIPDLVFFPPLPENRLYLDTPVPGLLTGIQRKYQPDIFYEFKKDIFRYDKYRPNGMTIDIHSQGSIATNFYWKRITMQRFFMYFFRVTPFEDAHPIYFDRSVRKSDIDYEFLDFMQCEGEKRAYYHFGITSPLTLKMYKKRLRTQSQLK